MTKSLQKPLPSLQIKCLIVGQLQTNCYLAWHRQSREAFIIDPGDDAEYISRAIQQEKLAPIKIVATHGHFDHILAAVELKFAYNIPFAAHSKDEFLIKQASQRARYFLGNQAATLPLTIDEPLQANHNIHLNNIHFKVMETPGHTPGSISLYSKPERVIFCGDLMFDQGGLGRTDFSYSNPADLQKSIQKTLDLPPKTAIYPGHGPATTVAEAVQFML